MGGRSKLSLERLRKNSVPGKNKQCEKSVQTEDEPQDNEPQDNMEDEIRSSLEQLHQENTQLKSIVSTDEAEKQAHKEDRDRLAQKNEALAQKNEALKQELDESGTALRVEQQLTKQLTEQMDTLNETVNKYKTLYLNSEAECTLKLADSNRDVRTTLEDNRDLTEALGKGEKTRMQKLKKYATKYYSTQLRIAELNIEKTHLSARATIEELRVEELQEQLSCSGVKLPLASVTDTAASYKQLLKQFPSLYADHRFLAHLHVAGSSEDQTPAVPDNKTHASVSWPAGEHTNEESTLQDAVATESCPVLSGHTPVRKRRPKIVLGTKQLSYQ